MQRYDRDPVELTAESADDRTDPWTENDTGDEQEWTHRPSVCDAWFRLTLDATAGTETCSDSHVFKCGT